jgi:hypothetical protein
MSRKAMMLAAVLAVSTGLFGQGSGAQEGTTGPAQANPDSLNNGGNLNINNGFVSSGVAGAPVLSTPSGTFASPAPTAGISDAGRAGISANTPANTGVQSSLENSTVVYINGAPVNPPGVNISPAANGPGSPAANGSGRIINDVGPSYFSNTLEGGGASSVGEAAAQMKALRGTANARMLTNDDVQKMVNSKSGVTVAKNMPPLGPGAAIQGGNSQNTTAPGAASPATAAQGAGTQPPGASPSGTQVVQGPSAAGQGQAGAGQQSTGTPPPVDTTQAQPAGESPTAGNSTTPQINQNQQSNDAHGRSRLPATSTFLPLLGLLGIASGGLGLWFRKFRR